MIGEDSILSIVDQYDRNGWTLRRVLLSAELQNRLGPAFSTRLGGAEIRSSDIDAGWFSRASRDDSVAWELRWFSEFPFALVEVISDEAEPNEVERILRETEDRLRERLKTRAQGH